MMQELLGGAALIGGERKISISGTILEATQPLPSSAPSPSLSPSSTTTATASSTATNSSTSTSENLRCPRCDSTNTKFCYYNNYNLTQPRHFCKTCRRYWTKGGALRNVPIGGGCRKNKSTTSASPASVGRSSSGKIKTFASEIGRSGGFGSGFDTDFASSPILWASPHNSHLLALLRGDQNPNPSGLPGSISVKDEGAMIGIGTQVIAEPAVATGALNARILGLEPMSQASSVGLCSPFWKNNQHLQAQQQPQNGFLVGGDAQNSGLQELYQRLKSSTSYYNDSSPVVLGNVGAAAISTSSSSSSTILDSSPVVAGELGYWNPTFSWSDLPN